MTNEKITLTKLETKILDSLINNLYAEPGFSDVSVNDIHYDTNISTKQIRGGLSSLVKKGVVSIDSSCSDNNLQLIYLNQDFWFLHPEWYII